jgi:hypothetical protein
MKSIKYSSLTKLYFGIYLIYESNENKKIHQILKNFNSIF